MQEIAGLKKILDEYLRGGIWGGGQILSGPNWHKLTEISCSVRTNVFRPTQTTVLYSAQVTVQCLHFIHLSKIPSMTLHEHRKKTCKNSVSITTESDSNIKYSQAKIYSCPGVFYWEGGRSPPRLPPGSTPHQYDKAYIRIAIRLRYDYDMTTTKNWQSCSFFGRVEWKQARAIRRSRIVVVSQL